MTDSTIYKSLVDAADAIDLELTESQVKHLAAALAERPAQCGTRKIVEECARKVELHAQAMREDKLTLTADGVSAIAKSLLTDLELGLFGDLAEIQTSSGWLADALDNAISIEICTVDAATGQHTRHYLDDEGKAVLANAVNALRQSPAESDGSIYARVSQRDMAPEERKQLDEAVRSLAEAEKPVAWQRRTVSEDGKSASTWFLIHGTPETSPKKDQFHEYEFRPLYAAPPCSRPAISAAACANCKDPLTPTDAPLFCGTCREMGADRRSQPETDTVEKIVSIWSDIALGTKKAIREEHYMLAECLDNLVKEASNG